MIGTAAGDIIGSPYVHNPRGTVSDYFFPLFSSSEKVDYNSAMRRVTSRTYDAKMGVCSRLALAATDWYLSGRREALTADTFDGIASSYLGDGRVHPSGTEVLAACATLARLCASEQDALTTASVLVNHLKPQGTLADAAMDYVRLCWAMRVGTESALDKVRESLTKAGYDLSRGASELRPFLDGTVTYGENGRTLVPGGGRPSTDASLVIPAVYAILSGSGSFEEAVRRAVALGGNSSLLAALVGGAAELRWDIPQEIRRQTLDYFSAEERALANRESQYIAIRDNERYNFGHSLDLSEINGKEFSVIRVVGVGPIYVIDENDTDVREAVAKAHSRDKDGIDYTIIIPAERKGVLEGLSRQQSSDGRELSGTYWGHPLPEERPLWLQDGEIRSSTTRVGMKENNTPLLPKSERVKIFNEWNQAVEKVKQVRTEMEKMIFKPEELEEMKQSLPEGQELHFSKAFYPVVRGQHIEVWQGDILRARGGIDRNGEFKVDFKAKTGGFQGEYLEGVLSSMELVYGNANLQKFMDMIDYYCLDHGKVPTEEEAKHLKDNDEEAANIRLKYYLNSDRVFESISSDSDEVPVAVGVRTFNPDLPAPRLETGKAGKEAQRHVEQSRGRYEGRDYEEIVNNLDFPDNTVFTIGHSNMSAEEFDALLNGKEVYTVIDIRSKPSSKLFPQFNADRLEKRLEVENIQYLHFPEFGGRQMDRTGRQMTYEESMKTQEFRKGMQDLLKAVKGGCRVALMCSESDPMDSHRMLMLGRALTHPEVYTKSKKVEPVEVQHITRKGYCLSQGYFEKKLMDAYQTDLDGSYKAREQGIRNGLSYPKPKEYKKTSAKTTFRKTPKGGVAHKR